MSEAEDWIIEAVKYNGLRLIGEGNITIDLDDNCEIDFNGSRVVFLKGRQTRAKTPGFPEEFAQPPRPIGVRVEIHKLKDLISDNGLASSDPINFPPDGEKRNRGGRPSEEKTIQKAFVELALMKKVTRNQQKTEIFSLVRKQAGVKGDAPNFGDGAIAKHIKHLIETLPE